MKNRALTFIPMALLWLCFAAVPGYSQIFDATEEQAMTETLQHALEYNNNGQESYWTNPATGRSGSVVAVNRFSDTSGLSCREYIVTSVIDGDEERQYGTACKKADGRWMVVLGRGATGHAEMVTGPKYVYVYRDPYKHYYPWIYHAPAYYPHRIFFSFVFAPHGRHFQRANFYPGHRYYKNYPTASKNKVVKPGRKSGHYDGRRSVSHGTYFNGHIDTRRDHPTYGRTPMPQRNIRHDSPPGRALKTDTSRRIYHRSNAVGRHNEHLRRDKDRQFHDRKNVPNSEKVRPNHSGFKPGVRNGTRRQDAAGRAQVPEVNNIHRQQGVDVWGKIRSDWGYKRDSSAEKKGSHGNRGSSGLKRGSHRDRR